MATKGQRRIEIDDSIRLQMSVRIIEEEEIEKVVNDPQAELLVHRRGRPIEGRFLYRGSPRPGRMLEVECQLRADTGMYRVIKIREV